MVGLFAGAVHGALGGLVIGAWSDLHPDISERLAAPGGFYRHYGARDVVNFCLGHLIFGAVAGTTYGLLYSMLTGSAVI